MLSARRSKSRASTYRPALYAANPDSAVARAAARLVSDSPWAMVGAPNSRVHTMPALVRQPTHHDGLPRRNNGNFIALMTAEPITTRLPHAISWRRLARGPYVCTRNLKLWRSDQASAPLCPSRTRSRKKRRCGGGPLTDRRVCSNYVLR